VSVVEHKGENGMSQEQEMRFEEGQREEPKSTFKDEIFGYRSYASEVAGQKIQQVSEQKSYPTHSQRLFLAVISLGMLMFISITAMFIYARMGMTPAFTGPGHIIYGPDGGMVSFHHMGEHGMAMARYYSSAGGGNELISWLLLVPLFLFFVATIAVNRLFSRGSK
jgi:hypothetical protein